ncbi:MAG: hypothetical protein ACR2JI_06280 [Mycobacterium sp.]
MTARRKFTAAALIAACALGVGPAPMAWADPPVADDPVPAPAPAPEAEAIPAATPSPVPAPPLVSSIGNALGQRGDGPTGPLGLPDLSAYGANLLLGQNPAPAAPAGVTPALLPRLSAFDPNYLVPQNLTPAIPGAGTPAPGIGPTAEDPSTGRIAFLRRLHEMYAEGELTGALLGQMSPEEFEANLAESGTAPDPQP